MDVLSFLIGKKHNGGPSITVDSLSVTDNGTYTAELNHAYNPVNVSVQPPRQSKNITPSETAQTVSPDENYYGLSEVQVDAISSTYVGSAVPTKVATTYTPTTTDQTIAANQYLTGAQTIKGDANLTAGNIKKNVTIFGVNGSYEGSGGGGSSVPRKDVNFIDYDGTVLYAYTALEFAELDAMPANPTHQGLTAQGWNWTLADAKTYVAASGTLDIGQMYTTADGKTRLYITIPSNAPTHARTLELKFGIASGNVTVDYGDGSTAVTVTDADVSLSHDYTNTGDYVITLTVNSGTVQFNDKIFNDSNANATRRPWLKRLEIGSSLTSIGGNAFTNCYGLQSITIPNTVTSIANNAFYNCYGLQITIPNTVTSIGGNAFFCCYGLQITIPSTVTSIGGNAFSYCYGLQSITIPNTVTSIVSGTFTNCYGLQSVTIPNTVTSIGGNAFANCYGLRAIHFKNTTPPTVANNNAWTNLSTGCKIYVPTGKLSDYTGATNYPSSSTYTYVEE